MIEWTTGAEQQLYEIRWSFQTVAALDRFELALEQAFEQLETSPNRLGCTQLCTAKMYAPS